VTRFRWGPEDKRAVLEAAVELGNDRVAIAHRVGCTYKQLDNFIPDIRDEYKAAIDAFYARQRALREVPGALPPAASEQTVRPFAVPIPAPAQRREGELLKAVVFSDSHIPYQDDGALACVEAVIQDAKPDILVHLGDLIDAGELSEKFPVDPRRLGTLQQDIDFARTKLHQWAQLAPQAERWILEGNHESRLQRAIWRLQGPAREIARLDTFYEKLSWPELLQLKDIGWKWIGYREQPGRSVLPKLLVKHGDIVSQWAGFTAKREWMASGRSGISGHTHRAVPWPHTDDNGVARWIEDGCTCRYDIPWATHTDWQQAVTILTWNADRYLMDVEMPFIRNGQLLWRDKVYGR